MVTRPLYAELLGDHFEKLPPALREFHRRGGLAVGRFSVERGGGVVAGAVADLMGLPASASDVRIRLMVTQAGAMELWDRWFAQRLMRTEQWARGGLLIEQAGMMRLGFRVSPDGSGFTLEAVRCWWLGIAVARRLRPRVQANVRGEGDGWIVDVRIEGPRGGLVCRYGGRMHPV